MITLIIKLIFFGGKDRKRRVESWSGQKMFLLFNFVNNIPEY